MKDEQGNEMCARCGASVTSEGKAHHLAAFGHEFTSYPRCTYCGMSLSENERDAESNSFFSAHFTCVQPTRDGRFEVRAVRVKKDESTVAIDEGVETWKYTTAKRAHHEAMHLAQSNRSRGLYVVVDSKELRFLHAVIGHSYSEVLERSRSGQRLNEIIERLYAHDELAADGFAKMYEELQEASIWDDADGAQTRYEQQVRQLTIDAETILGAYEEV